MTPDEADNQQILARAAAIAAGFNWCERLLRWLSLPVIGAFEPGNYERPTTQWSEENALSVLIRNFPELIPAILRPGCRVLDYGCGDGFQSVAFARAGATAVLGVDLSEQRLQHGRRMAADLPCVQFATKPSGQYDVVVALNSFEHFPDPDANLAELAQALAPGGQIFISFGPPWFAPYGAHAHFFTRVPWVHLIFSERTMYRVRRLYRDDDICRHSDSMNQMSIRRFERLVHASGLQVVRRTYSTVRGLPLIARIPFLRELFITEVSCVLTK